MPYEERFKFSGKKQYWAAMTMLMINFNTLTYFPQAAFEHGSAVFVLMYLISMTLFALPLLLIETALGQFTSSGLLYVFRCTPIARGHGGSIIVLSMVCTLVMTLRISRLLLIFWYSMEPIPPWEIIYKNYQEPQCDDLNITTNKTCIQINVRFNETFTQKLNASVMFFENYIFSNNPGFKFGETNYFSQNAGLNKNGGGSYHYPLMVACFCTIIVSTLTSQFSMSGAIMSQILFFVIGMFMLCISLSSAMFNVNHIRGIVSLLTIYDNSLADIYSAFLISIRACLSSFFFGSGTIFILGSFLELHHETFKSCVRIAIFNVIFSLFLYLFYYAALIGHLFDQMSLEEISTIWWKFKNKKVLGKSPSILTTFTTVLSVREAPKWSITLLFFGLFLISLQSLMPLRQVALVSLQDEFVWCKNNSRIFSWLQTSLLASCFIPICSQFFIDFVRLSSDYLLAFATIPSCLMTIFIMTYAYGTKRFLFDIEFMSGEQLNPIWLHMAKYLIPVLFAVDLFQGIYRRIVAENSSLQYLLVLAALFIFPWLIWIAYKCYQSNFKWNKEFVEPNPHWGPSSPQDFNEYQRKLQERNFAAPNFLSTALHSSPVLGRSSTWLLPKRSNDPEKQFNMSSNEPVMSDVAAVDKPNVEPAVFPIPLEEKATALSLTTNAVTNLTQNN